MTLLAKMGDRANQGGDPLVFLELTYEKDLLASLPAMAVLLSLPSIFNIILSIWKAKDL